MARHPERCQSMQDRALEAGGGRHRRISMERIEITGKSVDQGLVGRRREPNRDIGGAATGVPAKLRGGRVVPESAQIRLICLLFVTGMIPATTGT